LTSTWTCSKKGDISSSKIVNRDQKEVRAAMVLRWYSRGLIRNREYNYRRLASAGACEYGNELSGSVTCREFLD
jgi:hypothetical protein